MTPDNLKQVLAKIQLGDSRQVDALVLREWFDTIGHLEVGDALMAVTLHRQESTQYLMPAHIVANVKRLRAERSETALPPQRDYESHPQPLNYDAMTAAWNDPVRFAAEVAIYNDQLRAGGYPEVRL